jgi:hypothetical protein
MTDKHEKIWRECIAKRMGACQKSAARCLGCGAIEQALRGATLVRCRWPHLSPRQTTT